MSSSENPRRAIKEELTGLPVNYTFGMGGKHPYVMIHRGEVSRKVVFSGSPSDFFCVKNVRGDVRRALKELGVRPLGTLGRKIAEAAEAKNPMTEAQQRILPDLSKTPNGNGHAGPHTTKAEPEKAERKKSAMSHDEVITITTIMLTKADVDSVNRVVKYHEGWSDERVHEMLRAAPGREHLQLYTIVEMRREKWGDTPQEIEALRAIRAESSRKAQITRAANRKGTVKLSRKEQIDDLRARIEILEGAILGPKARL